MKRTRTLVTVVVLLVGVTGGYALLRATSEKSTSPEIARMQRCADQDAEHAAYRVLHTLNMSMTLDEYQRFQTMIGLASNGPQVYNHYSLSMDMLDLAASRGADRAPQFQSLKEMAITSRSMTNLAYLASTTADPQKRESLRGLYESLKGKFDRLYEELS